MTEVTEKTPLTLAELTTRCGCERVTQISFPPPRQLYVPMRRQFSMVESALENIEMPTRVFDLVSWQHKDKYYVLAHYEERE